LNKNLLIQLAHSLLKEAKENKLKTIRIHSYNNYAGYGIEGILEGMKVLFWQQEINEGKQH